MSKNKEVNEIINTISDVILDYISKTVREKASGLNPLVTKISK